MPLRPDFELREFIEPTIRDGLFENVETLKERISAKLSEILPANEYLVSVTEPDENSTTHGTIYVKMESGQFKAVDFAIQPVNSSFDAIS